MLAERVLAVAREGFAAAVPNLRADPERLGEMAQQFFRSCAIQQTAERRVPCGRAEQTVEREGLVEWIGRFLCHGVPSLWRVPSAWHPRSCRAVIVCLALSLRCCEKCNSFRSLVQTASIAPGTLTSRRRPAGAGKRLLRAQVKCSSMAIVLLSVRRCAGVFVRAQRGHSPRLACSR